MEIKEKYTDEEIEMIIESYVNYGITEKESKKEKESLRPILEYILGNKDEYSTKNHKIWYKATERKNFDEEGLKEKYPEIWKEFSGKKVIISLYAK